MEHAENEKTGVAGDAADLHLEGVRDGMESEIRDLQRFANRGLWALSLFLIVSTLAWRDFWFLPSPDSIAGSIGPPPAPLMISLVLVLYTFSAIILSLSRMMGGVRHKSSFCHVGYLVGFYLFYYLAQGLRDNYWAVFCAGSTILCLETYRIWTYCSARLAAKHEQLAFLNRTGRLPSDHDEDEDTYCD